MRRWCIDVDSRGAAGMGPSRCGPCAGGVQVRSPRSVSPWIWLTPWRWATIHWPLQDATALPLDAACVDSIITNPPYGERHGRLADLPELYSRFLAEAARVLRPGGRCAALTTQAALMDRLLDGRRELVRRTRFGVDVVGLAAHVHVLEHI